MDLPPRYDFDGQLYFLTDIRKLPQVAVSKAIRSESDAGSIGIADIETLPYLPLAECPRGPVGCFPTANFYI